MYYFVGMTYNRCNHTFGVILKRALERLGVVQQQPLVVAGCPFQ